MSYFIIIFQHCCALRAQLCREMRENIRLKIRKIARSHQEHPTKSVKGQTWKKALMYFVKYLLRYQKKKLKGKFTFVFNQNCEKLQILRAQLFKSTIIGEQTILHCSKADQFQSDSNWCVKFNTSPKWGQCKGFYINC